MTLDFERGIYILYSNIWRLGRERAAIAVISGVGGKDNDIGDPPREDEQREKRVDRATSNTQFGLVIVITLCSNCAWPELKDAEQESDNYLRHGQLEAFYVEIRSAKVNEEYAQQESSCSLFGFVSALSALVGVPPAVANSAEVIGRVEEKAVYVLGPVVHVAVTRAAGLVALTNQGILTTPIIEPLSAVCNVERQFTARPQYYHRAHKQHQSQVTHVWLFRDLLPCRVTLSCSAPDKGRSPRFPSRDNQLPHTKNTVPYI